MRCLSLLLVCGLAFVSAQESSVLDLVDSDFDAVINQHETALVMFYAPWCGHCKKIKPEYEKAATDMKGSDTVVAFVKVDCTEGGKEVCNKHGVSGYPTLKIFRNGQVSKEYNGPRDASGIVKYMKAQVGPSSKELSSVEALEAFISKDDVAVVGFFQKDSDLKAAFLGVADKLRETVRFGHASNSAVLEKQGVKDAVVLFRPKQMANKFEDGTVQYTTESSNQQKLETFIRANYHGLVGHRTRENGADFKQPLVIAYYGVDYVKNPKGTNYWRNRVLKVAKSFVDQFTFAISAKDDFQHELNEFGFDYVPSDKPLVFVRTADGKKYAMKEEFSVENLEAFLNQVVSGEVDPYIKSEPVPEDNSGPVKVAVAKNFDEIVTKNEKDVLVEFYAPWCGHCKKLTPIFEEVGEKLKGENVDLVKMDATANDVPSQFEVRGFPTLFWLPSGSKEKPIKYEGGREVDDFIKYIAQHATNELSAYDRSGNAKKTEL
uniref:Protein disulfide-isomerase n=2 Tax=Cacopsylla melanoneura TaxID=428564 RepID=A0A8D8ULV7_9HEMI